MIARDRLGLDARKLAGIDRVFERDHGGPAFPRAELLSVSALRQEDDRKSHHRNLIDPVSEHLLILNGSTKRSV
jgi:hypothetical protein